MKVLVAKTFKKAVSKQSGKRLDSIRRAVQEVVNAKSLADITDLKKMVDYNNIYRIRVGSQRAFFTFHVEIVDDTVIFHYLVNRGEAYSKEMQEKLKHIDK